MQNSVLFRILQALGGLLLIAVAVNSDWADAMANFEYGKTVSIWAARVMWSVGLLLVILPAVTVLFPKGTGRFSLNGYCVAIWLVWAACLYASNQTTTSTYTHGQAMSQGVQNDKHAAHLAAQAKIDAARKRLAENAGPGNTAANGEAEAGAQADLIAAQKAEAAACKGKRAAVSDSCTRTKDTTLAARGALAVARADLAKAQERDGARADLAKAEADADAHPDSIVEERKEGVAQAIAQIQLLLTLLSKLGMVLLTYAAHGPAVKPEKAKRRERGVGPIDGGTPLPANVTHLVTRKDREKMHQWLESVTVPGSSVGVGAIRKEYRRKEGEIDPKTLLAILRAIPSVTVQKHKSGYILTGLRLKTAEERRSGRRVAI